MNPVRDIVDRLKNNKTDLKICTIVKFLKGRYRNAYGISYL